MSPPAPDGDCAGVQQGIGNGLSFKRISGDPAHAVRGGNL